MSEAQTIVGSKPAAAGRARQLPLRPDQWSAPLRLLLSLSPGGTRRPMNVFATLARHESLFWAWLAFAGKLLAGRLDARVRELAILRTAQRCGCAYEWSHHRKIARGVGLTDGEIDAIASAGDHAWANDDRLVLDVVDELHTSFRVSDATWARMEKRFKERERIELLMLVGHYHMVAFTLNSLGVEVETGQDAATSSVVRAIQRVVLKGKRA
jgi:4-carboxymuconolactone decarboxylase